MTVTAASTGTGSEAGLALTVKVLTGQAASPIGTTGNSGTLTAPQLAITPGFTGSWVYGAVCVSPGGGGATFTANGSTTFSYNAANTAAGSTWSFGTYRSTATTTASSPVTLGGTAPTSTAGQIGLAQCEIKAGAGLAEDASAPATAVTTAAATIATASFTPPPGSLLVAMAVAHATGTNGQASALSVSDSSGLTWTKVAATVNAGGTGTFEIAAVFTAQVPAAAGGAGPSRPGRTWLRRFHHQQQPPQAAAPAGAALAAAGSAGAGSVTAAATIIATATAAGAGTVTATSGQQPVGGPAGGPWVLVFADEFTDPLATGKPDWNTWSDHFIEGDIARTYLGPTAISWVPHDHSGEVISGGVLSLVATNQGSPAAVQAIDPLCPNPLPGGGTPSYTSGILQSHPSFQQTYGYFEARIRVPSATAAPGSWPAFWLFSADAAGEPEADIEEYSEPSGTATWHDVNNVTTSASLGVSDTSFHVYGFRWTATAQTFFVDGSQVLNVASGNTSLPMHILLDMYVTTSATGAGFPCALDVDYVRAWTTTGVPARPSITSVSPADGIPVAGSLQVSFGAVSGATSYRVCVAPVDQIADGVSQQTDHSNYATGASGPLTVSGLVNGARYTATVAAVNATGYSTESLPVPSLVPATSATAAAAGAGSVTAAATVIAGAPAVGAAAASAKVTQAATATGAAAGAVSDVATQIAIASAAGAAAASAKAVQAAIASAAGAGSATAQAVQISGGTAAGASSVADVATQIAPATAAGAGAVTAAGSVSGVSSGTATAAGAGSVTAAATQIAPALAAGASSVTDVATQAAVAAAAVGYRVDIRAVDRRRRRRGTVTAAAAQAAAAHRRRVAAGTGHAGRGVRAAAGSVTGLATQAATATAAGASAVTAAGSVTGAGATATAAGAGAATAVATQAAIATSAGSGSTAATATQSAKATAAGTGAATAAGYITGTANVAGAGSAAAKAAQIAPGAAAGAAALSALATQRAVAAITATGQVTAIGQAVSAVVFGTADPGGSNTPAADPGGSVLALATPGGQP